MVTKAAKTVRTFSRARSRFKSAKAALADVQKKSGIGKEFIISPDHTAGEFRFKVSPKSEAPKSLPRETLKSKARRSAPKVSRSLDNVQAGSPALAVAVVGLGLAGLLVYRYRAELKSRFLAKRSRVRQSRRSRALPTAVVPVDFPAAAGQQDSPFRLPGGADVFNSEPTSFEFPQDTFPTGDGFDVRIRPPIAETGEIVAHTSI